MYLIVQQQCGIMHEKSYQPWLHYRSVTRWESACTTLYLPLSFLGTSHSSLSHAEQRLSFTANHSHNKFTSQGRTGKHPYRENYKENKYYFSEPCQRSKLGDFFSLDFVEFEEFKSADLTLTCSSALIVVYSWNCWLLFLINVRSWFYLNRWKTHKAIDSIKCLREIVPN